MKVILVTGAGGFVGRNLCVALRRNPEFQVLEFTRNNSAAQLADMVQRAEFVFHLAGVNRPKDEGEFATGNATFTREFCALLAASGRSIPVVYTSSTQAEADNAYGRSKKAAEDELLEYQRKTGSPVYIFRLPNIFGKWSRSNYNTVVATFCHNISRGLPVQISNRASIIRFVYIDDVVRGFVELATLATPKPQTPFCEIEPVLPISVGDLHDKIVWFREQRRNSLIPDLSDTLTKYLYSTYLAFTDPADLAYPVTLKSDDRGWLFELVKSRQAGQIFVSTTRPGVTRGNHYHDSKIEKFCVIQGAAVVRFRHILEQKVIEYPVNDREIRVVDIPPGYTHSIENVGSVDLITLFWANEIFDPQKPDTHFVKVLPEQG